MNTPKLLLLTAEHRERLEKLKKSGISPAIILQWVRMLLFKVVDVQTILLQTNLA